MKNRKMTAVLVDRVVANDTFDTVTADNAHASAEVARTLIEAGHRHVLLLGLSEVSKNVRTRISAFKQEAESICGEMTIDVLLSEHPSGRFPQLRLLRYLDQKQSECGFFIISKRHTCCTVGVSSARHTVPSRHIVSRF